MLRNLFVFMLFLTTTIAGEYVIDDTHSRVGFSIRHMMISNVNGEFKKYDADIEINEKTGTFLVLDAEIETKFIDTGIQKRDNHLKSPDFFDAKQYPLISFKMKEHIGDLIKGDLTIDGVTKAIALKVEIAGFVKDPWGNKRTGFSLHGKINRSDFGLTWNKMLETGGLVVGDEVKLQIDVEAISLD